MKHFKRFLAFSLCLALLVPYIPAYAATAKNYADYANYMCVGDSISAGCGLMKDGTETNTEDVDFLIETLKYQTSPYMYRGYDFDVAPNAYHSLVAEELGAKLYQCGRSASRAVELRYMLDGIYNEMDADRNWAKQYYDTDQNGFTLSDVDAVKEQGNYIANYKKADLITLNVGTNDIFTCAFLYTTLDAAEFSNNQVVSNLAKRLISSGDVYAAFGNMLNGMQSATETVRLIFLLLQYMEKTFEQYQTNYKALLDGIYALNPDVTLVSVGVYNVLENFSISDEATNVRVSLLVQDMTERVNSFLKELSSSYPNYYYADVVGTATYKANISDEHFNDILELLVHPTIEGNHFIADQILACLPEVLSAPAVTASNVASTGKIKLSWKAVPYASQYDIYRSTTKNGTYKKIYTTSGTTYTNTSAKAGIKYFYKVKAISGTAGLADSAFSNRVYRTCDLARPTGLSITRKNGHPRITWNAVTGADQYKIYRCKTRNGTYSLLYTTTKTTFTNTGAIPGNTYYYKVKAVMEDKSAAASALSSYVYIKAK